jgi:hypothetical protein
MNEVNCAACVKKVHSHRHIDTSSLRTGTCAGIRFTHPSLRGLKNLQRTNHTHETYNA